MKYTSVLAKAKKTVIPFPVIVFFATISAFWAMGPAFAHHPMDARDAQTFSSIEGLISGLGHPIIGTDHLFFLLSIGLVSSLSIKRFLPLLLFSGFTGTLTSLYFPDLINGVEIVVGLSLCVATLVCYGFLNPLVILPLIFCHGYVLGETIIGAEPTPLISYCLGLIISQTILILLSLGLFRYFLKYQLIMKNILFVIAIIFALRTLIVFV